MADGRSASAAPSTRWRRRCVTLPVVSILACAPRGVPVIPMASSTLNARSFGDTTTLPLRLLSLDVAGEVAHVGLRPSSHVIVLGVRPGREIEVIAVTESRAELLEVSMRRYEEPSPSAAEQADARAAREYDRCVAMAEKTAQEQARQRAYRRDSTGKLIPTGADPLPVVNLSACRRAPRVAATPKRMPPREPAERYFVVLASTVQLPASQLEARLSTLTAVAPDVATTIEAIAAGLFAGHPGAFSGAYAAW